MVITSATLNGEKFSAYFDDCPVLTVPGRVFDVQLVHSKENHESDILTAAVETALQIHLHEPPGDILVFLTGQAEIDKVCISLYGLHCVADSSEFLLQKLCSKRLQILRQLIVVRQLGSCIKSLIART